MLVEGKEIAARVYAAVKQDVEDMAAPPRLGILTCAPTFETEKYLSLKEKKSAEVGIATEVVRLPSTATTEEALGALSALVARSNGVVVQLPLPPSLNTEDIIAAIPATHDVDALNGTSRVLSPVVGALKVILENHGISPEQKHVTIIGSGKLVGLPAYRWFVEQGAYVSVVTKDTADITFYTRPADIIVSGAGVPNLITPEMVKEGVVMLDAGTSEDGGMLRGDADPLVKEKSSLFTPVPGGIGPITIAMLLKNVVELSRQ